MSQAEKQFTEKESLDLIATMINKAKNSYHDTGISAMMWGAVIAVCSLVKLSELHFDYRLPFDIYWLTHCGDHSPGIYHYQRKKRTKSKNL